MIGSYDDFVEALFEIPEGRKKIVLKELITEVTKFAGISISKNLGCDTNCGKFKYFINSVVSLSDYFIKN